MIDSSYVYGQNNDSRRWFFSHYKEAEARITEDFLQKIAEKISDDNTETDYDGSILYYYDGNCSGTTLDDLTGEAVDEDGCLPSGDPVDITDYENLDNSAFRAVCEDLALQYFLNIIKEEEK